MKKIFQNGCYWFCAISLNRTGTAIACDIKPTKVWAIKYRNTVEFYTKPVRKDKYRVNFYSEGNKNGYLYSNIYDPTNFVFGLYNYMTDSGDECKLLYNRQIDNCLRILDNTISTTIDKRKGTMKRLGSSYEHSIDYNRNINIDKFDTSKDKEYFFINYLPQIKKGPYKYFTSNFSFGGEYCKISPDIVQPGTDFLDLKQSWYPYKPIMVNYIKPGGKTVNKRYLLNDPNDYNQYLYLDKDSALNSFRRKFNEGFDQMTSELNSLRDELEAKKYEL